MVRSRHRRPRRLAEGEGCLWSFDAPQLDPRRLGLLEDALNNTKQRATTGIEFLCQSGLPLHLSEYYNREVPDLRSCCPFPIVLTF